MEFASQIRNHQSLGGLMPIRLIIWRHYYSAIMPISSNLEYVSLEIPKKARQEVYGQTYQDCRKAFLNIGVQPINPIFIDVQVVKLSADQSRVKQNIKMWLYIN